MPTTAECTVTAGPIRSALSSDELFKELAPLDGDARIKILSLAQDGSMQLEQCMDGGAAVRYLHAQMAAVEKRAYPQGDFRFGYFWRATRITSPTAAHGDAPAAFLLRLEGRNEEVFPPIERGMFTVKYERR